MNRFDLQRLDGTRPLSVTAEEGFLNFGISARVICREDKRGSEGATLLPFLLPNSVVRQGTSEDQDRP
jgi:hypothetical protein